MRRAEPKSASDRDETTVRLITVEDAELLAALQSADREILRRWEPERDDDYFTPDGQRSLILHLLDLPAVGRLEASTQVANEASQRVLR